MSPAAAHPRSPRRLPTAGLAPRGRGRPKKPGAGVSHLRRERFARWAPVHVTLRALPGVRSLRGCSLFRALHAALRLGSRDDFRIVDYSVQRNHFHFNVEARSSEALSRGMQGLTIRLARTINRRTHRRGKVFGDRFYSRVLRTPRDARNARRYVLNNARRHARGASRNLTDWRDPCSSAPYFAHFSLPPGLPHRPPDQHARVALALGSAAVAPRTWLLAQGWRRGGSLVLTDLPGPPGDAVDGVAHARLAPHLTQQGRLSR